MPGRPDLAPPDGLAPGERAGRGALAVLSEIARLLNSRVDVQSAFDEVLRLVTELLGLRTAWLFLQGPAGRRLVFTSAHGLPPAGLPARTPWRVGWESRCGACSAAVTRRPLWSPTGPRRWYEWRTNRSTTP